MSSQPKCKEDKGTRNGDRGDRELTSHHTTQGTIKELGTLSVEKQNTKGRLVSCPQILDVLFKRVCPPSS